MRRQQNRHGWISVMPALVIIAAVKAYPMLTAIIKSFTNWDGMYKSRFIGLENYIVMIRNGEFFSSISNNFILLLFIPLQILTGLIVGLLLYEKNLGWRFFRIIYYSPQVISMVIIGFFFAVAFGYYGPVNTVLELFGVSQPINWLGNRGTALFVITFCLLWSNIGWQALLILGGMSSISPSIMEAAKIDGAGYWSRLFHIVMPMLLRVIEYSVIVSVIWVFNGMFSVIHAVTKGGPGYETTTLDYMIYIKAFVTGRQLGMACATAVMLMLVMLIFTKIEMTVSNKMDDWS